MTQAYRAGPADADVMAAIHASAFSGKDAWGRDVFALQLALPGTFGLVHPGGGLIIVRVAADEAEVLTIAVMPGARRTGIARSLLQEALQLAQTAGAHACFLEVSVENAGARALYEQAGFLQVGRRRNYYSDNSDALVLRLDLPLVTDSTCRGAAAVG